MSERTVMVSGESVSDGPEVRSSSGVSEGCEYSG